MDRKRVVGIILPLLILSILFLYSGLKLPEERPRTVRILDESGQFEGETVQTVGKLENWREENGEIHLTLERFGRTYEVRTQDISELDGGDTIFVEGRSFLKSQDYIDAEKNKVWRKEDRKRVYLLSFAGLALLLTVLAKDRKKLEEVVPWQTG